MKKTVNPLVYQILIVFSFLLLALSSNTISESEQAQKDDDFKKSMDSWLGATKNALLLEYGAPNRTSSDGAGGEILVFEDLRRAYIADHGLTTAVHTCSFYINKEGKVYYWKYDRQVRQGN
jgi:hypothetical protein